MSSEVTGATYPGVDPYGELVLSVHVAPRIESHRPLARAAFYPFLVGTTTKEAREHAIKLWHLPHFPHDIQTEFTVDGGNIRIAASHGGAPILNMHITDYQWDVVTHVYQAFTHDETGSYMATMELNADFSENEEERGSIELFEHPFTAGLDIDGVNTTPFRELWMRDGLKTFEPLETLHPAAGR